MKRATVFVGICLTMVALTAAARQATAETWAVIVGVGKYQSPLVKSLKFPPKDARDLRDALVNIGKVPATNVLVLTDEDATRDKILDAVDRFLKQNVKAGDDVLVSLAGHGVAKGVGLDAKSYFLGADARGASKEALESSAVSLRDLCTRIGDLPAAQFVLLDDACREDPTPGRGLKSNNLSDTHTQDTRIVPKEGSKANSATFYACQVGQRAYEDPNKEHGVFTYFILEAIKNSAGADASGRIELGNLASYVRAHVNDWAKSASIEQNPELVVSDADSRGADPLYVVKVGKASGTPVVSLPPQLIIDTEPETAELILNGSKVTRLPAELKSGPNTIRVEAPGYASVQKTVNALPGYQYQMAATLVSTTQAPPDGVNATQESQITVLVAEAQRAEARRDWRSADAAYTGLVGLKYAPAYERLAEIQQRQGQTDGLKDAIGTLVKLNTETKPTAHTYNLLARAYSSYALKDAAMNAGKQEASKPADEVNVGGIKIRNPFGGKKKKAETRAVVDPDKVGDFRVPDSGAIAAALARKAADEATKSDASSVDSYLAQGFSLVGGDVEGKNSRDALAAFRSAITAGPNSSTTNYGLGYGLYYFATYIKNKEEKVGQLRDAVTSLDRAIQIRPGYYEALRIRGYCHHLLGEGRLAKLDYDSAIANRGAATDPDEVASLNVTQAVLLRQEAEGANGQRKTDLMDASNGYMGDAQDTARDIHIAIDILRRAGFGGGVVNFLDAPMREIYSKVPSIPGLPSLPGIRFP